MFDFAAYLRTLKPPKPILPEDVRRRLHELGWTTIRQSNLRVAWTCDYKQRLASHPGNLQAARTYNIFAVLGILAHRATQYLALGGDPALGRIADWWLDELRAWVREDQPLSIEHHKQHLRKEEVLRIVARLGQPLLASRYLIDVIQDSVAPLWLGGHVPLQVERQYRVVDGEGTAYPIVFQGTIDLLTKLIANTGTEILFLWDAKFYGLFSAYLDEDTKYVKQNVSAEETRFSAQHRHYSWLMSKVGLGTPDYYGFVFPVNSIPYLKDGNGYKKGQPRGSGTSMPVPVPGREYVNRWERDLVAFLTAWSQHQPKRFAECATCYFRESCLKDPTADLLAASPLLDYLRD